MFSMTTGPTSMIRAGDDDLPNFLDDRANNRRRVHASIRTRLKFHGTARHESQDNPWFQGQAAF